MKEIPLSYLLRPASLDDMAGQKEILGEGAFLRKLILEDKVKSVIFYGPPGTGKSTLANIIAHNTHAQVISLNAVTSKIDDIRDAVKKSEAEKERKTVLIVDEIHRFNKTQQDGLLPHVEDGTVILIGMTIENPFFYLTKALISRSSVFEFKPLVDDDLRTILGRLKIRLKEEKRIDLAFEEKVEQVLIEQSSGDARRLINACELLIDINAPGEQKITLEQIEQVMQRKAMVYDRDSDSHYDTISAFIKSVRGSDPDAAIYWAGRMLEAGEPPEFIARRLVILASEDIGNAEPMALVLATAAFDACRVIGMPEARIILAQAVTYLASAPKSNASYMAIESAMEDIRNGRVFDVPNHLRDSNFYSKEKLGHGKGYVYPHEFKWHYVKQNYMPSDRHYYEPGELGYEKKIRERLDFLRRLNGAGSGTVDNKQDGEGS